MVQQQQRRKSIFGPGGDQGAAYIGVKMHPRVRAALEKRALAGGRTLAAEARRAFDYWLARDNGSSSDS